MQNKYLSKKYYSLKKKNQNLVIDLIKKIILDLIMPYYHVFFI